MTDIPKRRIAASYLPSRYHYWYSLSKLATDPLYESVIGELKSDREPLLDIGCGIGLLLHALRAGGSDVGYVGIDSDSEKIELARQSAAKIGVNDAEFRVCDLAVEFPEHRGSVALLDVLQYLDPPAQDRVLDAAARSIGRDGLLVMRGGFDDASWRARVTRTADRFGHAIRWMKTPFRAQPDRAGVAARLTTHGLQPDFRPAWGNTPFNNWIVVARRRGTSSPPPAY
jgi:SAM-dependent methyltransferase